MRIYHYTSIQTLALILKHKTIRFNRLDLVDDIEEAAYGSGPMQTKLGQYQFVSCWTKSENENLALWNMYTRYEGVRIGIDSMPFYTYNVGNDFVSLLEKTEIWEEDYYTSSFMNPAKLYDVVYVNDPEAEIKKLATEEGHGNLYKLPLVGIYKREQWAMQEESRFKIAVFPMKYMNERSKLKDPKFFDFAVMGELTKRSYPLKTQYFDLPIREEALSDIHVMMGPLTTEADRCIVEALLKDIPNAQIEESMFLGKLRKK